MTKNMLTFILMVLVFVGGTMTAFAAGENCLDVRDYGYHRYAERDCGYSKTTKDYNVVQYNSGTKHVAYYDVEWHYWECVCGLRTEKIYDRYYLYTKEIPWAADPADYY